MEGRCLCMTPKKKIVMFVGKVRDMPRFEKEEKIINLSTIK